MLCLGFVSLLFLLKNFFPEKKYSDKMWYNYHKSCTEYYAQKLGLKKIEIEKKDIVIPENPDWWSDL